MKKKSCALAVLFIILAMSFIGCRAVTPAKLPERTPIPEETPQPTPTPSPTPEPIQVPKSTDELCELIGMQVYAPEEPLPGMVLSSIGYDGESSGALKYTDETGYLLYSFSAGISPAAKEDIFPVTASGIEVSLAKSDGNSELFTYAYWQKNGNTYQIMAEPGRTADDMSTAVSAMIAAPQNAKAPSQEVNTLAELAEIVGFSVPEPTALPEKFAPAHQYALYGQTAVQIYSDGTSELTYMKSEGTLLPPRFSNIEYTSAGTYDLPDGCKVYLYYTENGISLAEWTRGGFGYSITATDTNGNPVDLKKKTFLPLIDGFYEELTEN